jgi:16S rRNA processing protein RimM
MKSLTKIGKIQSTHGLKGELVVSHLLKDAAEMKDWEALMLELNKDSFIPYFLQSFKKINHAEILVLLEGVDSPELAKELLGSNVYASPLVTVKALTKNDWDEVIGYFIRDITMGAIGQIQDVSQGVGQEFFELKFNGKDIMIPLQESWIKNINAQTKTIEMELPDGFLEVFG